jgi:hypothetical protein
MLKMKSVSLALLLALGLGACGDDDAAANANSAGALAPKAAQVASAIPAADLGPAQTTMEMMRLAKTNDLKGMFQLAVPPSVLKEMTAQWETKRKEPITDTQRKEFAEGISKILAPGAIDEMMAAAEPQLAQLKGQMPMYVGMGGGMLKQSIQANPDLNETQKKQALEMVGALETWAGKTDFADPNRLRKAATEFANGLRATNITTLDQMQALSFDQMLGKGGVLFAAMKKSFNAYDLNLDDMFASTKSEQISLTGDSAKIKTTMTFLGQQIVSETDMMKIDGRWFSKESQDAFKKMSESMTATNKAGG